MEVITSELPLESKGLTINVWHDLFSVFCPNFDMFQQSIKVNYVFCKIKSTVSEHSFCFMNHQFQHVVHKMILE